LIFLGFIVRNLFLTVGKSIRIFRFWGIPTAPAAIAPPPATGGGGFRVAKSVSGSVLQTVLIQASTTPTDPSSWAQIGSLLPTTNPFIFTDPDAGQYPIRFYRVLSP
jgi:hypothetical protein